MSEVIYLSDVRLSFPNLVEPQVQTDAVTGQSRSSYNCEFLMPEAHPGFQSFLKQYATLMHDKFKEHAGQVMQMIQSDRKSRCFGAGSEKVNKNTFQPYDGYQGMVFITAGSRTPPQVFRTEDGKVVDPSDTMQYQMLTRKMYGGCRVNAAVKPWVQDNKHGRGIRCDLIAIQFLRDDAAFGEAPVDVTGMFGGVSGAGAPAPTFGAPAQTMPAAPTFGAPTVPSFFGQ